MIVVGVTAEQWAGTETPAPFTLPATAAKGITATAAGPLTAVG